MSLAMAATTRPVCATRTASAQSSRARSARSVRVVAMAQKQEAKVGCR